MKETAIKMHLYIQNIELTQMQADQLLKFICNTAIKSGVSMSFQIHEVEVSDDGQ